MSVWLQLHVMQTTTYIAQTTSYDYAHGHGVPTLLKELVEDTKLLLQEYDHEAIFI